MPVIEEADYLVRITLTTTIAFSPIERPTPLSTQDAIDNAFGTLPDDFFAAAEAEGWTIGATADRLS